MNREAKNCMSLLYVPKQIGKDWMAEAPPEESSRALSCIAVESVEGVESWRNSS